MKRSIYFIGMILGFLAGVFVASEIWDGNGIRGLVVLLFLVVGYEFMKSWLEQVRIWEIGLIVLIGFFIGIFRFYLGVNGDSSMVGSVVKMTGCIESVDVRSDKVNYKFVTENGESFLMGMGRYPSYEYGDCLLVQGKIEMPGRIKDFDYGKYLRVMGFSGVVKNPVVLEVSEHKVNFFVEFIYWLKGGFDGGVAKVFPEPYGGLVAGILAGERASITEQIMLNFNNAGLTHVMAVSGYNISVLVNVVCGIFGFLGRKKKVVVSVVFVVIFTFFVGASASVVRAAIMGVIGLFGLWFGRQYLAVQGLLVAAFLMTLLNPKVLVFDVGFELSFLATVGIVCVSPLMKRFFEWVPEIFGLRESLMTTVSAQLAVLPIIILNFEKLSVVSVVANLLVLPFIPLVMLFGFLAVVCGFLWGFLGGWFGFVCYVLLKIVLWLVELFASFKYASIEITWFSWWISALWYLGMMKIIKRRI